MKHIYTIIIALLITANLWAQSPEKMSYQAIIRNSGDTLVVNKQVRMLISILRGSVNGPAVYIETHTPTTNVNGLVSFEIGMGTTWDNFSDIDWNNGPYFVKTETDPTGGINYTIIGSSQLLSVPYALHAKTAETIAGGIVETDPVFEASIAFSITPVDIANWNVDTNTQLSETTVDAFVANNGYLISELDGSVSNELQTLSISNDTIYLTDGSFVKLPAGFNGDFNSLTNVPVNLDTDITDDFDGQYISLSGTPTNVSTFTNDAGYLTSENDASVSNELQSLSISNDTIYLTDGSFVKLPAGFSGDFNSLTNVPINLDTDATDDFDGQYISLSGTPTNVSVFTNDASYLTTETDGSITNEIQDLQLTANNLSITKNGSAVTIDLGPYLDNSDTHLTELEVDSYVSDNGYLTSEIDGSISNELQTLSISDDTIYLTDGSFVKLPAGFSGDFNSLTNVPVDLDTDATDDFDGQYSNLTGAPTIVSSFANDAGYLTSELDASVTNEIQDLQLIENTLTITNNGSAVSIDLSPYLDNSDTHLTELEVDSYVSDNGYLTSEIDGSVINELQTLSISNDTIYLTDGNFVKLPAGFNGDFNSLTNVPVDLDTDATDDFDGKYSSLTGAPTIVSSFTNDAGYLTSELDASVTNEIQDLQLVGNTLTITNNGSAASIDLSPYLDNSDTHLTELEVDSYVSDNGYLTSEIDGSVSNELQTLSISNDTIYLTDGSFIKLPATTMGLDGAYDNGIGINADSGPVTISGTDGIISTGTYGSGSDLIVSGKGTRLMWYPKKSAFRAGYVSNNNWDNDSIGNYSVAMGGDTKANGSYATAMGISTSAKGVGSTALGFNTVASGNISVAMGFGTNAKGNFSTALGKETKANGLYSTAIGNNTIADSYNSFAVGGYNIGGGSSTSWIATDPVFEIGIGLGNTLRDNAMTVLKNGNIGIGVSEPDTKLEISGQIKITGGSPETNKVLTSDANGLASWQSVADDNATNELQTLSISNDTIFLTDGSFVKLPAGFSGSYNDLINKPLNMDEDATDDFDGQYNSLTGAPTKVSAFSNDVGYLTSEIDGSATNELQTLSISNDTIYLTDGSFVKLPVSFSGSYTDLTNIPANLDTDATDDFDGSFTSLVDIPSGLSDGDDDTQLSEAQVDSYVSDNGYLTAEVDGSVTNEIELPTQTGNSGKMLTTDGTNPSWSTVSFADLTNVPANLDTDATDDFDGSYTSLTNIPVGLSDGDDNTQLSEAQIDSYVSDNGYLTTEVDGSVTNEIELPTQTGNSGKMLTTDGTNPSWSTVSFADLTNVPANLDTDATDDFDGSFTSLVDVPAGLSDGDDNTQLSEAQVDSYASDNGYLTAEVDGSTSNELQTLSISNDTIYLTDGNFVKLPSGFSGSYNDLTNIPADLSDGDDNTQLSEAQVDSYVSDNGYLTTEVDGSVTNEIELPTQTGNSGKMLTTDGTNPSWSTVNFADLTNVPANLDTDATDDFDGSFTSLVDVPAGLSDGDDNTQLSEAEVDSYVSDNGYLTAEVDGSVTNELQNLSQVLTVSNDGGASQIKNIADPADAQDAATKAYVDLLESKLEVLKKTLLSPTDFDGNTYDVVIIGDQIWMAENLKSTHYADGTEILLVEDETDWDNLSETDKAYCYYDNSSSNGNSYGALYTWAAATRGSSSSANPSGVQGACPDNWHLPSDAEWKQLEMYLGMSSVDANSIDYRGTDEGGKIKSTTGWDTDGNGTNSSGFNALPAGCRVYGGGGFYGKGYFAFYWAANESDAYNAYQRRLQSDYAQICRFTYAKDFGYSVRCVRD
jgi:uncharacterized protein (TIGR02145 family)